jgi:H(+)-translocating pyrophosphatase
VRNLTHTLADSSINSSLVSDDGEIDTSVNKKVVEISDAIARGAKAFLMAEYKYLAVFLVLFGIALFARVGGGIYTKAADVGADLVGKVEAGIPEDDPRNPAVIADNVGDNVGDVAGMGADLFESYVGAIIATMVLGTDVIHDAKAQVAENAYLIILPIVLCAIGTLGSMFGRKFVYTEDESKLGQALHKGLWVASAVFAVGAAIACAFLDDTVLRTAGVAAGFEGGWTKWGVYLAVISGLVLGVVVGVITEHYTTTARKPVREIARQSLTGSATNLIQGLATGMASTWAPLVLIALATLLSYKLAGIYGVSIAAVGMLSTLGISLGVDAYGPVADNAGGIAEMTHQDPSVRKRTDSLDAAGNTTAAIGKGFAIGSAALTALALFQSFLVASHLDVKALSLSNADVVAGLLIGGMLPYEVGRQGRPRHGRGGAPAVFGDPRHHGGHRSAGLRKMRQDLHGIFSPRNDPPGHINVGFPHPRGLYHGAGGARRTARRLVGFGSANGDLFVEHGRCVG